MTVHPVYAHFEKLFHTYNAKTKRYHFKCNHCNSELEGKKEFLVRHLAHPERSKCLVNDEISQIALSWQLERGAQTVIDVDNTTEIPRKTPPISSFVDRPMSKAENHNAVLMLLRAIISCALAFS
ncbi:hypothetical protein GcM3_123018, partial [Golovinomyces cichoracearum]